MIEVDREVYGMKKISESTDASGDEESLGNPTVVKKDRMIEVKVDLLTIAIRKNYLSKIEPTDDRIVIDMAKTNTRGDETTRPGREILKNKEMPFVDKRHIIL